MPTAANSNEKLARKTRISLIRGGCLPIQRVKTFILRPINSAMGDSDKWWSKETIAVVTGGNKGLGYEIARQLGKHGLTVVLTARNEDRGQNAADSLKAKGFSVLFHQLDVTDEESVQTFARWARRDLGSIDILINNAAIAKRDVNFENARQIIATNYVAVKVVTTALLPLLRSSRAGARILNISSELGLHKNLKSVFLKEQLSEEEKLSEALIDSLAAKFLEDVKFGKWRQDGWVWSTRFLQYSESKCFLNAYTRVLARSLAKNPVEDQKIFVNVVTPGFTKSDLSSHAEAAQTVEKGADSPVWLALLPRDGYPHGKFFQNREEQEF